MDAECGWGFVAPSGLDTLVEANWDEEADFAFLGSTTAMRSDLAWAALLFLAFWGAGNFPLDISASCTSLMMPMLLVAMPLSSG